MVWRCTTVEAIDEGLSTRAGGLAIVEPVDKDHPGTSGSVARPLPVATRPPGTGCAPENCLAAGQPRLAHKALYSFRDTWYPLRYLPWDLTAASSSASDILASWFTVRDCHAWPKPGGARSGREVGRGSSGVTKVRCESCSSHLDEAGEPSGATRDPRGRSRGRPTRSDGRRPAPTDFPARERG